MHRCNFSEDSIRSFLRRTPSGHSSIFQSSREAVRLPRGYSAPHGVSGTRRSAPTSTGDITDELCFPSKKELEGNVSQLLGRVDGLNRCLDVLQKVGEEHPYLRREFLRSDNTVVDAAAERIVDRLCAGIVGPSLPLDGTICSNARVSGTEANKDDNRYHLEPSSVESQPAGMGVVGDPLHAMSNMRLETAIRELRAEVVAIRDNFTSVIAQIQNPLVALGNDMATMQRDMRGINTHSTQIDLQLQTLQQSTMTLQTKGREAEKQAHDHQAMLKGLTSMLTAEKTSSAPQQLKALGERLECLERHMNDSASTLAKCDALEERCQKIEDQHMLSQIYSLEKRPDRLEEPEAAEHVVHQPSPAQADSSAGLSQLLASEAQFDSKDDVVKLSQLSELEKRLERLEGQEDAKSSLHVSCFEARLERLEGQQGRDCAFQISNMEKQIQKLERQHAQVCLAQVPSLETQLQRIESEKGAQISDLEARLKQLETRETLDNASQISVLEARLKNIEEKQVSVHAPSMFVSEQCFERGENDCNRPSVNLSGFETRLEQLENREAANIADLEARLKKIEIEEVPGSLARISDFEVRLKDLEGITVHDSSPQILVLEERLERLECQEKAHVSDVAARLERLESQDVPASLSRLSTLEASVSQLSGLESRLQKAEGTDVFDSSTQCSELEKRLERLEYQEDTKSASQVSEFEARLVRLEGQETCDCTPQVVALEKQIQKLESENIYDCVSQLSVLEAHLQRLDGEGNPQITDLEARIKTLETEQVPESLSKVVVVETRLNQLEGKVVPDISALEQHVERLATHGTPFLAEQISGFDARLVRLEGQDSPTVDLAKIEHRFEQLESREVDGSSHQISALDMRLRELEGLDVGACISRLYEMEMRVGTLQTKDVPDCLSQTSALITQLKSEIEPIGREVFKIQPRLSKLEEFAVEQESRATAIQLSKANAEQPENRSTARHSDRENDLMLNRQFEKDVCEQPCGSNTANARIQIPEGPVTWPLQESNTASAKIQIPEGPVTWSLQESNESRYPRNLASTTPLVASGIPEASRGGIGISSEKALYGDLGFSSEGEEDEGDVGNTNVNHAAESSVSWSRSTTPMQGGIRRTDAENSWDEGGSWDDDDK